MRSYKFVNARGEEKGKIESDGQKIMIYGDICSDRLTAAWTSGVYPQGIADMFAELDKTKPVDIYINSGGGDVFAALAICSIIKRHEGETAAHIDGIAASAASVIACACDKVEMPEYAQMMIHRPWTYAYGNADDLLEACDMLDKAEESMVSIYKGKLAADADEDKLREALKAETWYTGKDICDMFVVSVTESESAAAALSDYYGSYKNQPKPEPEPKADHGKDKEAERTAMIAVFEKFYK